MSLIRVYPQHWFSPRNAQQPEQSFQPLDRLHHDIDRLFNGFFTPGWPTSLMDKPQADIRPSLDIHSDDKAYTIHMEVPGVDPDEVKVEVRDGMLTVEGEKKMESCAAPAAEGEKAEAKEPVCHVQERVYGSFCRQIGLAEDADVENISASHKNGVLTIVIPRKQPEAPAARSITVQKQYSPLLKDPPPVPTPRGAGPPATGGLHGLPRMRQAAFFIRDRTAAACPVFPRPAAHPDTPAEGKDCTTPCGTPGFGQSASALSAFRSIQKPARPRSRNIRLPADRLPHDRHCKYPPFPRCIPAPPQDRDARFPSGPAFSAARARKKAASRAGTPPCQIRCSAVDYFLPAGSMTSTPSM